MKLSYVVLAHQHPKLVIRLVRRLISQGSVVSLHYDLSSGDSDFHQICSAFKNEHQVLFAERVNVGWGEWSIIQATLNALQQLATATLDESPDYVHLVSGADYPIRSEQSFRQFLERNKSMEFIQAVNINESQWVTGGLSKERFYYRHYFNWQKHEKLFDLNFKLQKSFLPKREFPHGLIPHMGSQWWTLTWGTCCELLEYSKDKVLTDFFSTVWIPDEMYIQTLVAKIVGKRRIVGKCLTYYQFNHNGLPLVFTNGHHQYLNRQPFFFARKVSPFADILRDQLDLYFSGEVASAKIPDKRFGTHTKTYENFVKRQGDASKKGRRQIGYVNDAWYGDLEWNDKPYYVIVGGSRTELRQVQAFLNHQSNVVCHGELFNTDYAEFAGDVSQYAGLRRQDVALRDHSRPNFLVRLLRYDLDKVVAFLLPFGEGGDLLEMCLWDRNARIIALKTNPFLVFRDFYEEQGLPIGGIDQLDHNTVKSKQVQLAEIQRDKFSVLHDEFHEKHALFWERIHAAQPQHFELCLYDADRVWMVELLSFVERHVFADTGVRLVRNTVDVYDEWLVKYQDIHRDIPNLSALFDQLKPDEQAIFRTFRDPWKGNLSWNDRPYYVIVGGSRIELRMVQAFLNKQVGITCHGELFNKEYIDFVDDLEQYDDIDRADVILRDYDRPEFLAQVLNKGVGSVTAFLLPFDDGEGILDVLLWDNNARVIALKTNPFLILKELMEMSGSLVGGHELSDASFVEKQRTRFAEMHAAFHEKHERFWRLAHQAQPRQTEICLYDNKRVWMVELLDYIERHLFQDVGKRLTPSVSQKDYDQWLSGYRHLHRDIPNLSRLFYELKDHEQQLFRTFRSPEFGELSWNQKPYLVVSGGGRKELSRIQEYLNKIPGVVCHGDLFSAKSIDFVDGVDNYAEYERNSRDSLILRDQNQQGFLARVIQETEADLVAFLLPFGDDEFILNVGIQDHNAGMVLIDSNPFEIFAEAGMAATKKQVIVPALVQQEAGTDDELSRSAMFDPLYKRLQEHTKYIRDQFHHYGKRHVEVCLFDRSEWERDLVRFLNRWHEDVGLSIPRIDASSDELQEIAEAIKDEVMQRQQQLPLSNAYISRLSPEQKMFFRRLWQVQHRVV